MAMMTVEELIERLEEMPPVALVFYPQENDEWGTVDYLPVEVVDVERDGSVVLS